MTKEELNSILKTHKEWLSDNPKGQRANLRGADLRRANLMGANLMRVNLMGASIQGTKGIILIQSQYPYQSYGYYHNNEKRVRLGCYDRTIEEWDADFWNNEKEFPKDSPKGKKRFMIHKFIKDWLIKNEKTLNEK